MSLSKAERVEEINDKIRSQLFRKGTSGLSGVATVFRQADFNGNKKLDPDEFEEALSFAGVFLSASELKLLFETYDRDGDGNIGYEEFIKGLAPDLAGPRRAAVESAFRKIDTDGSGVLTVDDIANVYNVKKHPDVAQGRKTEKQVLVEFLSAFEGDSRQRGDGTVTFDEFLEYYTDLSGSIPSEEYFLGMMAQCWDISKVNTVGKVRSLTSLIQEKVRQKAKGGKNPPETLRQGFKFFDGVRCRYLSTRALFARSAVRCCCCCGCVFF
jgi:Ca2+-binding EF-hand superfamily protein